jgi:hypothetical protein
VPRCILRDVVGLAAASSVCARSPFRAAVFLDSSRVLEPRLTTLPPRLVQGSFSREIRCRRRLFHVSPIRARMSSRSVVWCAWRDLACRPKACSGVCCIDSTPRHGHIPVQRRSMDGSSTVRSICQFLDTIIFSRSYHRSSNARFHFSADGDTVYSLRANQNFNSANCACRCGVILEAVWCGASARELAALCLGACGSGELILSAC